jgi:hypothetical protein
MASDIDTVYTVLPRSRKIQLTCGSFEVRPLSNFQFIILLADLKDMQGHINGKLGEGKDHEVIIELLTQAGAKLPALLARLMGMKDPGSEVLTSLGEMTLEDTSVAALAIAEVNNFSGILKNFQQAIANKTEQSKK